jgi:hypothetical protein
LLPEQLKRTGQVLPHALTLNRIASRSKRFLISRQDAKALYPQIALIDADFNTSHVMAERK